MSERKKQRFLERGREGGVRDRVRHRPHIRPTVYGYLTEEKESLRQGFAALFLSSVGELIAGPALASITETLDQLVGLAVLIPAAIGMRGAIFGAMGSRTSTAIQTGLFSFNLRLDGQLPARTRPGHLRHPDNNAGGGPAGVHEPYNRSCSIWIGVDTCAIRDLET